MEPKAERASHQLTPSTSSDKRRLTREESDRDLAEAFIAGLRAWYDDPSESVDIYIEKTVRYLLEEHPDGGNAILLIIAETEPEYAWVLTEGRTNYLNRVRN